MIDSIFNKWRHAATCWWNSNLVSGAHFFSTMGPGLITSLARLIIGLLVSRNTALSARDHDNRFFFYRDLIGWCAWNCIIFLSLSFLRLQWPISFLNIVIAWMCNPYSCTYDWVLERRCHILKISNRRSVWSLDWECGSSGEMICARMSKNSFLICCYLKRRAERIESFSENE